METTLIIKSRMKLHNVSMTKLADELGICKKTLEARFKDGNWRYREIVELIRVLDIDDPQDVFFKGKVA